MRRGFTLLETMIVVLIVTAISAIVLPGLASRAASGRIGHAAQSLESGAALAAAEAMERGVIVALVAEDWDGQWVLWAEDVEPERLGEVLAPRGDLPPLPPEEDRTRRVELASFDGVELTDELPPVALGPEEGGPGMGSGPAEEPDLSEEEEPLPPGEHERFMLGVFFPDGSCRAGPAVYLVAEDGRRRVVRFSPLTGRVDVRVLPQEQAEAEQLEGEGDGGLEPPEPERPGRRPPPADDDGGGPP
ncbi:MAG: prepilin-type N-terminal cleavage/methylation domain-containing protein [Phycisphaerales bacterium]|nr:prepilin-type N-terminal cleavage/methylation domain-containing protein [Phycisphaerales bacterium]